MPDNHRPPTKPLRLEYHDLLSLFEFLDNGDGQITLLCSIRKGRSLGILRSGGRIMEDVAGS